MQDHKPGWWKIPPKPDLLVDALQDPVHKRIGKSRPAKSLKKNNAEK